MTREQFDNELRRLLNADPFQPFAVSLKDGSEFFVDDPAAVASSNGGAGFIALKMVNFFNCETICEMRASSELAQS